MMKFLSVLRQIAAFFDRPVCKLLLKLSIAAGIVLWLIFRTPASEKLAAVPLNKISPFWYVIAALFYAFHIFVNAWRWHLLLRIQNIPCSLWTAVSLTMQSFFFSLVMPGGALGGDVVRAGFIAARVPDNQKFSGVFTILIDRFTGMLGIFSLTFLILPFSMDYIRKSDGIAGWFIWFLLAAAFAGIAAGFVVFKHHWFDRFRLYRSGKALADRFSGGLFSKVIDALDSYSSHPWTILICVLAGITGVNFSLGICMYCVCLGFGAPIPFALPLAAITLGNIAGLLPLTPSGVGMRDYCVIAILNAGGYAANALGASLLMTGLIIGFNLLGGVFFLFDPGRSGKTSSPVR